MIDPLQVAVIPALAVFHFREHARHIEAAQRIDRGEQIGMQAGL